MRRLVDIDQSRYGRFLASAARCMDDRTALCWLRDNTIMNQMLDGGCNLHDSHYGRASTVDG